MTHIFRSVVLQYAESLRHAVIAGDTERAKDYACAIFALLNTDTDKGAKWYMKRFPKK